MRCPTSSSLRCQWIPGFVVAMILAVISGAPVNGQTEPSSRAFQFHYGAQLTGLQPDAKVRVWIPIATTNAAQDVELVKQQTPGKLEINREATYGNSIGYFEFQRKATQADDPAFELVYDVQRREGELDKTEATLPDEDRKLYLQANELVPTTGRPAELVAEKIIPRDPEAAGRMLYDVVETHMKYDKSKPGYGKGDAVWACDSQTGNCTDFHSLFIALARNQNIPARFEIGFPLGEEPSGTIGGYHCWAWFHLAGKGWLPVDISEADKHPEMREYYFGKLTPGRIAFSKGRDIKLVPKSKSGPLNYFIYPHVEVDGQPWPKDKIKLKFSYQAIEPNE